MSTNQCPCCKSKDVDRMVYGLDCNDCGYDDRIRMRPISALKESLEHGGELWDEEVLRYEIEAREKADT